MDACSVSFPSRALAGQSVQCRPLLPPAQALLTAPGMVAPAPQGAAGSQGKVLHPGVGGVHPPGHSWWWDMQLEDTPVLAPISRHPQISTHPAPPDWGLASPLLPKLEETGSLPHLTPSPPPAPRTAPCKRWDQLGWALGRLVELPGSSSLAPASIIYKAGRVSQWQPGGGLGEETVHTHTCTHSHTLISPCPASDNSRKRGRSR